MKKLFSFFALSCLALVASVALFSHKAEAVSGSDWQAGRIIDDSVFFNPNTLSAQDIQNFLNTKVPTCDTNGTQIYSGSTTRGQYGTSRGYPPPYTCLKDYSQNVPSMPGDSFCGPVSAGSMSAATIIKVVSAACNVNPEVIIVLLQKEQSLITDDWPWPAQYTKATGYGCPDSSLGTDVDSNQNGCYDEFEGFFKQIYYGARQYQKYAKQPDLFNYRAGQTSFVGYNPNGGCSGTNVTMQDMSTAGLYNYTPYQPNQAALNNLYGSGDVCSAYGNRNFWRMFWDWFGNPIGSEYAWLIDSFTYSGGDNVVTTGYTETLTLKARNVGRQPWYNHGDHPIRLGTWEPPDRTSSILPTRLATLQESVVQPNQVGTFQFQINPSTPGVYPESLNLVAENYAWMSWPGFRPTIVVSSSPYQWQINQVLYGDGTGVMNPDGRQLITVKATNTGNVTWSKTSGPPVRLATWGPGRASGVYDSSDWISPTRATDMNESSVAPGQVAGFQFYVHMPASGNFYEHMNLVAEGQAWMNDPGLILYLHGRTYTWQPVWQSLSTGNANIGRNQTFDITIRVRNTGEMAWKKSDPFQIHLGTTNPQNRGSGFYTPGWLNDTRPATLIENDVEPGQEGTFTFNARTPNTPGARYENYSLVADGIEWFNDPGFYIYINVL